MANPSVFIDWETRLLGMGRVKVSRLGHPWHAVTNWRAALRPLGPLRKDALRRFRATLVAPPPAKPTQVIGGATPTRGEGAGRWGYLKR